MKKIILVIAVLISACSPSKKATNSNSTSEGLSYSSAIVIKEKSESTGVNAEYKWIKEHYSNYKIMGQSLNMNDKKPYDIITIKLSDGKELPLYFDISNYFGKF